MQNRGINKAYIESEFTFGFPSLSLASSPVGSNLINEFRLFVNPTALGAGRPMFKDLGTPIRIQLVNATKYSC